MQPEHTICRECGTGLLPGERREDNGRCRLCRQETKVKRETLQAKIAANWANATRFRRIAVVQKDAYRRSHWFACATAAIKRAEAAEAELKQMGNT